MTTELKDSLGPARDLLFACFVNYWSR